MKPLAAGHLGGCSALLVSVNLGEERILAERSGMMPICTLHTAHSLGFLRVPKVHLTKGAIDTLLVLDSAIIPEDEDTHAKYLPSRLLMDYVRSVGSATAASAVAAMLKSRAQWQLQSTVEIVPSAAPSPSPE